MTKWYKISLLNLVILATLGLILRYKINFPLPFLKQENLLHAHSHFAFNGWISFLLQLLLLDQFTQDYKISTKFWDRFFIASTFVNYAMIVSFIRVGYAGMSIALSTIALWLSYAYSYKIYTGLPVNENKKISYSFLKASLFFLLLSSIGPYALAIIIAAKASHQYWYHNALYFFLHFQYNGWFTFGVLAFLFKKLEVSPHYNYRNGKAFFMLLAVTCIPSYLFTSLWHHRPVSVTVIIIATAIFQTTALFFLWKLLAKNMKPAYTALPPVVKWLYSIAISGFILKVLLQFFSVHPQLSQLAFGFRPIIIGYLHLIFLVFVSLFLLGLLAEKNIVSLQSDTARLGLVIFTGAVIINEILLAVHGFASIYYYYLPYINLILFLNTILILTGATLIYLSLKKERITSTPIINKNLETWKLSN
jgi:hypothetical protein